MLRIRTKLVLFSAIFYSVLICIIFILAVYDTLESFNSIYSTRLKTYISYIQHSIPDAPITKTSFDAIIKKIKQINYDEVYYQLYDDNNNLLNSDPIFNNTEFLIHIKSERLYNIFAIDTQHYLYGKYKLYKNGKYFNINLIIRTKEFEIEQYRHRLFFFGAIGLFLVLATFGSLYLSKLAFTPLKNIITSARHITAKNLSLRIPVYKPKDELRELSETLNDMISRLQQSFENQKQFIASASHEIKTPLTIIRLKLDNLIYKSNENDRKEINEIILEVDRLSRLTRSLLELTGLGNQEINTSEIIRCDEIIMECCQLLNPLATNKNITFKLEIDEPIEIKGNSELLYRMFINLLENAIKFSPENSTVDIIIKNLANKIEFTIRDYGKGINEKDLPFIFNPFYRSTEYQATIQGNGMGLAIVKEIIKIHSAEIEAVNHSAGGAEFHIKIPIG